MNTDKKKNKESFKSVELTKEELRIIEGGKIINPPSDGPLIKGIRPY